MKAYVQFYQTDLAGNLQEACGSDGVYILDARQSTATHIEDACIRAMVLSRVKRFEAFKIMKGDLKHAVPVTELLSV